MGRAGLSALAASSIGPLERPLLHVGPRLVPRPFRSASPEGPLGIRSLSFYVRTFVSERAPGRFAKKNGFPEAPLVRPNERDAEPTAAQRAGAASRGGQWRTRRPEPRTGEDHASSASARTCDAGPAGPCPERPRLRQQRPAPRAEAVRTTPPSRNPSRGKPPIPPVGFFISAETGIWRLNRRRESSALLTAALEATTIREPAAFLGEVCPSRSEGPQAA